MYWRAQLLYTGFALLGLGVMAFAAPPTPAADASTLPGGTYESIPKLPPMSGIWEMTFGRGGFGRPAPLPFTPKYEAIMQAYEAGGPKEQPSANCVPPGMPGIMSQPYPIEILFTPGMVTVIAEAYMQVRHIYTDGRKHPDDPDLTFNGNSIGHWEGDTLVVDSIGFTPDTPLGMNMGMRHSDKMHIVERFHLKDPMLLEVTTTIDDPEALTKPWTRTISYAKHPDWVLDEYICQQNNRNSADPSGKAGINLKR
ncbi:MAG TPA: hypothetical protein VME17_21810 [Bryobacteraceae bacterium]|nr:hypothetical protein [Bryobacteraceae bacterium]